MKRCETCKHWMPVPTPITGGRMGWGFCDYQQPDWPDGDKAVDVNIMFCHKSASCWDHEPLDSSG